jgi:hypothetical protein
VLIRRAFRRRGVLGPSNVVGLYLASLYAFDVTPEAQWYLVDQLGLVRGLVGLGDIEERRPTMLARFGGVLEAFRYLGAMTDKEVRDWNDRMLVAVGIEPPPPARPGTASAIWIGPGEPPSLEAEPTPARFVSQVAGPDREFVVLGLRLRVIAVELYSDSLAVRWRTTGSPDLQTAFPDETDAFERDIEGLEDWAAAELRAHADGHLRAMRLYRFELDDDVGTNYHHHSGGSSGRPLEMTGEARFAPAPPTSATRLILRWLGTNVDIPLRGT